MSRRRWSVVLASTLLLAAPWRPALAGQQHALLMWIGHYGSKEANLPGIELDARRARLMASAMGVPPELRTELSEDHLTLQGLAAALQALERRVNPGDRVFIYFSGHGKQIDGAQMGTRCSEGVVTREGFLYLDVAVNQALQRLADKATQVVMMNDSCHSGGAATKSFVPGDDDEVPKAYPGPVGQATANVAADACGQVVNKGGFSWAGPLSRGGAPAGRWLYLAGAAANEVAYATPRGSRATQAWQTCLAQPGTDTNRDGQISGQELLACAQQLVNAGGGKPQTLSLEGDATVMVAPSRR